MSDTNPRLTPEVAAALRDAESALWKVSNGWDENDQASWDQYVAGGNPSPFHMSIDEVAAQIGDFVDKSTGDGFTFAEHCVAMADLIGGTYVNAPGSFTGIMLGPWDIVIDTEGDEPRWRVTHRHTGTVVPRTGPSVIDNPAQAAEWIIANTPEQEGWDG